MYTWLERISWASNYAEIILIMNINAGICKLPNSKLELPASNCLAFSFWEEVSFSLLARFYIWPGVLFAINCNLPSKGKEFAPEAFREVYWIGIAFY